MTYVYLDQAHWIDLRQRDEDDEVRKWIESAIESEEITIEVLHTLLIETGKHADEGTREEHADYIYEMSRGNVLSNYMDVQSMEVRKFVWNSVGLDYDIEEQIRSQDIPSMYGNWTLEYDGEDFFESDEIDDEIKEEFRDLLRSRKAFEMTMDDEMVEEYQDTDWEVELVETIEETREEWNEVFSDNKRRRRFEIYNYFREDVIMGVILEFAELGLAPNFGNYEFEKYVQEGDDKVDKLFQQFPASYTYLMLSTAKDLQKTRDPKKNDLYDLFSLAVAIPYSDVVVTEKFWVAETKRVDLDEIYDTELLTAIDELPEAVGG